MPRGSRLFDSSETGYVTPAERGATSRKISFETDLLRLQHLRAPYRFHILRFDECFPGNLVAELMTSAASHAYHIRIEEQSFGVLDIATDHRQTPEEDLFLQDLVKRVEQQYLKLFGTRWVPLVVESIEGRTDEITGIEDFLLLALSQNCNRSWNGPVQGKRKNVQEEQFAFS